MRSATAVLAVALISLADVAAASGDEIAMIPHTAAAKDVATDISEEARITHGKKLFGSYCARCHGLNMVSVSSAFFDLRTFPHDDKPRFVNSVTNGKRAMPAWGGKLEVTEIENLWAYISSYKQ